LAITSTMPRIAGEHHVLGAQRVRNYRGGMADAPFLERVGIAYLERRTEALGAVERDEAVHILDEEEQRELRAIEHRMVGRAAAVGAGSGIAAALADVAAQPYLLPDAGFVDNWLYWSIVGTVSLIATAVEIALLYWDSLRSVHELARAAGVPLFPKGAVDERSPLAATLTRAALELPNPPDKTYGIDPYREVNKLQLAVASLIYKLKISITNLLAKVFLRRLMGRSAFRVYLEFVGVPVYAFWNGLVAFLIVREARLRAIGRSAARVFAEHIFGDHDIDASEKLAAWSAVASAVVRTHDVHPNLQAMLDELARRFGPASEDQGIDDTRLFQTRLAALSEASQDRLLAWLSVAAVLDGKVTRAERLLLDAAYGACGRTRPARATAQLRRTFVGGAPVSADLIRTLAGR
jgi:hypothetical protein